MTKALAQSRQIVQDLVGPREGPGIYSKCSGRTPEGFDQESSRKELAFLKDDWLL